MLRRIAAATAAVLMTVGVGTVASAPADAAHAGPVARAILPFHGHYSGLDGHHRTITFYYDGRSISNVRANGHLLVSSAPVAGVTVHHRCDPHAGRCVRGHWVSDLEFFGIWNDPNQGVESHFVATLVRH